MLLTQCPYCKAPLPTRGEQDGRTAHWYARVRFFKDGNVEAYEDSADHLPLGQIPQDHKFFGLPELVKQVVEWAHQSLPDETNLRGLDDESLARTIRGIRSTLSRNRGRGTMRIYFDTAASFSSEPGHKGAYMARVDIERAP